MNTILKQLQSYNEEGSNRRFQRVTSLEIHLNRYKTLGGLSYIKLPSKIAKEKAILNIKNKDEECFRSGMFSDTSTQLSRTLRGSQA